MEAIVFNKTPWANNFNDMYSMVDKPSKLAMEAQDRQGAQACAPLCTPSVCQLPSGPSRNFDLHTQAAVSVYSVFCSLIALMMITPEIYIVKTT
jgi:hypothetical protein